MDDFKVDILRNLISNEKKTFLEASNILQSMFPGIKGVSVRSLKRICSKNDISARVDNETLLELVSKAVAEVGPTYGRKMMKGFLKQKNNIDISQKRVSSALREVNPSYHHRRQTDTARLLNPIPYRALYFGHKLHIDQNEKLAMYGVTHVCAIDGHSRFVLCSSTMPIKNNVIIYEEVLRKIVIEHGLFDQVRVDHGKEFYLLLGMQEQLAHLRNDTNMPCYRQTQSKKNLPIERFWGIVNVRVNFPIKQILVQMDNNEQFDIDNQIDKFCVSRLSCLVASVGMKTCIDSWNFHPISNRGVPTTNKNRTTKTVFVNPALIPTSVQAVEIYRRVHNGRITEESSFGVDPLEQNLVAYNIRTRNFDAQFDLKILFSEVANEQSINFERAILYFIAETKRLASLI